MSVLLVPNYSREDAVEGSRRVSAWLEKQGIEVLWAHDKEKAPLGVRDAIGASLVVSFGGDGTLLRAARLVGYSCVPLLGISYGHLGFLAGADGHAIEKHIASALAGELHVERRTTLSATVLFQNPQGETKTVKDIFCLNELALSRGTMGDIVEFDIAVSGNFIDRLRADGFVVSTATGSTGYALSAGGPIVTPDFKGMVCVPIAPHTIQARAFLTSSSDVVELALSKDRPVDRSIFCDGRLLGPEGLEQTTSKSKTLMPEKRKDDFAEEEPVWLAQKITIARGAEDIRLLTDDNHGFYRSVSRVFYGIGSRTGASHAR